MLEPDTKQNTVELSFIFVQHGFLSLFLVYLHGDYVSVQYSGGFLNDIILLAYATIF